MALMLGGLRAGSADHTNEAFFRFAAYRNIHIVSLVHAIIIIVLAARSLKQPALAADKVFGWHETAEIANSVAAGYAAFAPSWLCNSQLY